MCEGMFKAASVAILCLIWATAAMAMPARTPAGARRLCSDYPWACRATGAGTAKAANVLELAKSVNRKVNFSVTSRSDRAQYGVREKWTLPKDAGDCEDMALLKMRMLIDRGVAPGNLRLAQVMKRNVLSHVVLLVRAEEQEYVLDSLSWRVSPRSDSRYVFLKQQNRAHPAQWETGSVNARSRARRGSVGRPL